MADTIKISDRMAEAILGTKNTAEGDRLELATRVGTTVALMQRELVRYDRERTRENGYEVHTLTPRGMNVRERLFAQPDAREFLVWAVDAAARKVTAPVAQTCDSVTREGMSVHACYLPSGHDRDHTNGIKTWPVKVATEPVVEDNSVVAVTRRVIAEHVAATKAEPVTEYSVKIWYRSGAYEGVAHSPEDLARKIFVDAVKSAGVEFAELHGPSGMLVESKTPNEEQHVSTEPEQQTENLFLTGLPLLHPEPFPPAPELPQDGYSFQTGELGGSTA